MAAVNPSEYKNYILTMLFLKYLRDLWKDLKRQYEQKYKGDKQRVQRALARERFVLPDECDFDYLYARRDVANIGELINIALERIEDANKGKLENVFRNVDFNSEPALGQTKERNRRLKHLLDDFNDPQAGFRAVSPGKPGRDWQLLPIPHQDVRRRRRKESWRLLYAGGSFRPACQACAAQSRRQHLSCPGKMKETGPHTKGVIS